MTRQEAAAVRQLMVDLRTVVWAATKVPPPLRASLVKLLQATQGIEGRVRRRSASPGESSRR